MVVAPTFHRSEAAALNALRVHGARAAIGLHLTLSAPFQPLTEGFTPLVDKAFPSYRMMLVRACLRQLDRKALEAEVAAQIRMFGHEFGRAPDFIDGHQHVHIFPQVRDALFTVAQEDGADRLDQAVRPRWHARLADRRSEGPRARSSEQAFPRARRAHWTCAPIPPSPAPMRSTTARTSRRCFRASSTGFRMEAWSCAIPAWSMPNCAASTR